jgi:site-specific DNA recombinase
MAEDIIASRMKDLETERAGLRERERLAFEATNVVELHPNAIERYRQAIATLQKDLAAGRSPETRAAFRNLVDHVLVRPTEKRAPYEVKIFGRLGALLGLDLYPAQRTPGRSWRIKAPTVALAMTLGCRSRNSNARC